MKVTITHRNDRTIKAGESISIPTEETDFWGDPIHYTNISLQVSEVYLSVESPNIPGMIQTQVEAEMHVLLNYKT